MSILLIRHGETPYNADRIVQLPDTPLNERGIGQARRLAARLRDFPVARILSSDYARARMTAEVIAQAPGLAVELVEGLRERNFGANRGHSYTELDYDLFAPDYHPPGGETWETFDERVAGAWRKVVEAAASTPGDLAVVTHALVCRSIVRRHVRLLAGMDPELPRWPNTALTVVEASEPWCVSLLACAAHLDETTADDSRAKS